MAEIVISGKRCVSCKIIVSKDKEVCPRCDGALGEINITEDNAVPGEKDLLGPGSMYDGRKNERYYRR